MYIPLRSGAPALVCVQLLIAWGVSGVGGATVVLSSAAVPFHPFLICRGGRVECELRAWMHACVVSYVLCLFPYVRRVPVPGSSTAWAAGVVPLRPPFSPSVEFFYLTAPGGRLRSPDNGHATDGIVARGQEGRGLPTDSRHGSRLRPPSALCGVGESPPPVLGAPASTSAAHRLRPPGPLAVANPLRRRHACHLVSWGAPWQRWQTHAPP